MRLDRRHRAACCLLAVVAVAGCSGADDASSSSSTLAPSSTVAGGLPAPATAPTSTVTSTSTSTIASTEPAAAPGALVVSGGPLPTAIVKAYDANGGDLVDGAQWDRRFGAAPIPSVSGEGVVLVEALRRFQQDEAGWVRTDEAGWLAMADDDRDTLVAELASQASVTGVPQRSETNDRGADCVVDTYPASSGVVWQIQGCSYEQFPGFVSLGVGRTGPTGDQPTVVDPTVSQLATVSGGHVVFTEVRLSEPGADGSTLHLSTQVSTIGSSLVDGVALDGPLAGWQKFPGDDSLLLTGPTGSTWTISDSVAVFDWAGRW